MHTATFRRTFRVSCLAALTVAAVAPRGWADPLEIVPGRAAAVVVIRDPDGLSKRLTELLRRIKCDATPISVDDMFDRFGLPAGSIVGRTPVAVVHLSADDFDDPPILVFRREEAAKWQLAVDEGRPNMARLTVDGSKPRFVSTHEGWTIVGPKPQLVRRFLRGGKQQSVLASMGAEERRIYDSCDAFAHCSMGQWQAKVNQALVIMQLLGSGATVAADTAESQVQGAALRWLATGLSKIAADMDVTAAALTCDDHSIRFTHFHSFKPDSGVAAYLRSSKMQDIDLWQGLNQRPFLAAFAWNWFNPADAGIMDGLMKAVASVPALASTTQPTHQSLIDDCRRYYASSAAAATVFDLTPAGHMRIWGTNRFANSGDGLQLLRNISVKSDQLMASFAPTWATGGEFRTHTADGIEILSMPFGGRRLGARERQMVNALYGPDASYQLAPLDDRLVGYCVSSDPDAIVSMARVVRGEAPSFAATPVVAAMMKLLPEMPALVALADVDRVTRFAPQLAKLDEKLEESLLDNSCEHPTAPVPPIPPVPPTPPATALPARAPAPAVEPPGPLVGWAMVVGPDWVRGEACMTQDDIVRSVPLVKRMAQQFAAAEAPATGKRMHTEIRIERKKSR